MTASPDRSANHSQLEPLEGSLVGPFVTSEGDSCETFKSEYIAEILHFDSLTTVGKPPGDLYLCPSSNTKKAIEQGIVLHRDGLNETVKMKRGVQHYLPLYSPHRKRYEAQWTGLPPRVIADSGLWLEIRQSTPGQPPPGHPIFRTHLPRKSSGFYEFTTKRDVFNHLVPRKFKRRCNLQVAQPYLNSISSMHTFRRSQSDLVENSGRETLPLLHKGFEGYMKGGSYTDKDGQVYSFKTGLSGYLVFKDVIHRQGSTTDIKYEQPSRAPERAVAPNSVKVGYSEAQSQIIIPALVHEPREERRGIWTKAVWANIPAGFKTDTMLKLLVLRAGKSGERPKIVQEEWVHFPVSKEGFLRPIDHHWVFFQVVRDEFRKVTRSSCQSH